MTNGDIAAVFFSIGISLACASVLLHYWERLESMAANLKNKLGLVSKSRLLETELSLENAMLALGEARVSASTNYYAARYLRLRILELESHAEDTQPQLAIARDSVEWLELFVRDMGDAASRCDRYCQDAVVSGDEKNAATFSGKAEAYENSYFRARRHLSALRASQ